MVILLVLKCDQALIQATLEAGAFTQKLISSTCTNVFTMWQTVPGADIMIMNKSRPGVCPHGAHSLGQCQSCRVQGPVSSDCHKISIDIADNGLKTLATIGHCCDAQICGQLHLPHERCAEWLGYGCTWLLSSMWQDLSISSGQEDMYWLVANWKLKKKRV